MPTVCDCKKNQGKKLSFSFCILSAKRVIALDCQMKNYFKKGNKTHLIEKIYRSRSVTAISIRLTTSARRRPAVGHFSGQLAHLQCPTSIPIVHIDIAAQHPPGVLRGGSQLPGELH